MLTHDVADMLAPVTTGAEPVLTTVSDAVGTLTHDVADPILRRSQRRCSR